MRSIVKPICVECCSNKILCQSYARWDISYQCWILQRGVVKAAYCCDCQKETGIEWLNLSKNVNSDQLGIT